MGCLVFVPLTFAYAGLIDDLGCNLGLPSHQQVEGEDEASIDMRSRELESQLDLCLLAKVIILLSGALGFVACVPFVLLF